jgi:GntR family transcriptional regulator, transcriptional repressor for pyruvate dehydrogenase complex
MSDQFTHQRPVTRVRRPASSPGGATAGLRPLQLPARDTAILDAIAGFILERGLKPGDRLPPERELCERLKVSRPTLREALKRWAALGILDMRVGSGTYLRVPVAPGAVHFALTVQLEHVHLQRTLELRRALEAEAAELAALRASDEAIAEIRRRLEHMERMHLRYGDAPEEDWEFHLSVYRAAGNPLFAQIVGQLHTALHRFWEHPFGKSDFARRTFPMHRQLYEAIAARDPVAARRVTLDIIRIVEEDLREAARVRQS